MMLKLNYLSFNRMLFINLHPPQVTLVDVPRHWRLISEGSSFVITVETSRQWDHWYSDTQVGGGGASFLTAALASQRTSQKT